MNDKRIALGVLTWFLGIIVVAYHHVGLHAAMASQPTNNPIVTMQAAFEFLPWIDWIYLALMTIVGSVLVVSGMFGKQAPDQMRLR